MSKDNLTDVLRALYDSEINCSISSLWDAGWIIRLGDEMNGFEPQLNADHIGQVARVLGDAAAERWPDSKFATIWKNAT